MSELRKCSRCGAQLIRDAPGGHCLPCLLLLGFSSERGDDNHEPIQNGFIERATSSEAVGDRIGRYLLVEQIGEGGCGVVYMAEQEEPVRRRVALKIIKLGMDTRSVIARFEAERQALAMMDHPNIARVFDAGATQSGRPYFVMELVQGTKITDYCDDAKLSTRQRLDLFIQVCDAVQHAHQKGVIHRDIKPSNVLVAINDRRPTPKIIDFGIAKATTDQPLTDKTLFTAFGQFLGTPAYMSPEQAGMGAWDIDTRSDIYSLGVLLYELLTGQTPFDPKDLRRSAGNAILEIIRDKEPAPPSTRLTTLGPEELVAVARCRQSAALDLPAMLRGDLDWIALKALEKDRDRRYETANGLILDLQRHLNNEPVTARPPDNIYRLQKLMRRHRLVFAASGIAAIALISGLGFSTWAWRREKEARSRAVEAETAQGKLRVRAEENERQANLEAGRSRQVAQFLTEILKGAEPAVAMGRDTALLRDIIQNAAIRMGQELKGQPEVEAPLRATLGILLINLAQYKASETNYRIALELRKSIPGGSQREVALSMYQLAHIVRLEGRFQESEDLYRGALDIFKKLQGEDHPDVVMALEGLATALISSGKHSEAESIERKILDLRRRLPGNNRDGIARAASNLGSAIYGRGDYAEAEALFREALQIYRSQPGNQHYFDVCYALNNLANALTMENKHEEAEAALRESLATRRELMPKDHPALIATLHDLGIELQRQNRLPEAESMFREALESARKTFPDEPKRWQGEIDLLGEVLKSQHKDEEYRKLQDELSFKPSPGNR